MADLFCGDEFTPADKLKAVDRELGYRRRVFARRVAEGKMKPLEMDREIAVFEAIADDYRRRVAPVAFMRDVDGTGSLHACAEGDPGAFPVFA